MNTFLRIAGVLAGIVALIAFFGAQVLIGVVLLLLGVLLFLYAGKRDKVKQERARAALEERRHRELIDATRAGAGGRQSTLERLKR